MPNALTRPGKISAKMVFSWFIADSMAYCGMIKTWDGSISWVRTMKKNSFLKGNSSLANAKPAMEEVSVAQTIRASMSTMVL